MNRFIEFTISLEIGSLILSAIVAIASLTCIIFFIIKSRHSDYKVDCTQLEIAGIACCEIKKNYKCQQEAYKIWVQMNTRVVCVPLNMKEDIIIAVNNSLHSFFVETRNLLSNIVVKEATKNKDFINLSIRLLNDILRPYLTKWGLRYKKWYDEEANKDENKGLSPQAIQEKFPFYNDLVEDLLPINKKIIFYNSMLKTIIFDDCKNKKKNKKGK